MSKKPSIPLQHTYCHRLFIIYYFYYPYHYLLFIIIIILIIIYYSLSVFLGLTLGGGCEVGQAVFIIIVYCWVHNDCVKEHIIYKKH